MVAMVVLEFHDGIVDQWPDGQGETAQRHEIQRVPRHKQPDDRTAECQRD